MLRKVLFILCSFFSLALSNKWIVLNNSAVSKTAGRTVENGIVLNISNVVLWYAQKGDPWKSETPLLKSSKAHQNNAERTIKLKNSLGLLEIKDLFLILYIKASTTKMYPNQTIGK
jgi:hypothetical protein